MNMGQEIAQFAHDCELQYQADKCAQRYTSLVRSLRAPYETHEIDPRTQQCVKCLQDKLVLCLGGCYPGRRAVDLDEYNQQCCVDAHVYEGTPK